MNQLPPDRLFFSAAFSAKLAAEVSARRGARAGLPGAVVPDVPIGILRDLRKELPRAVDEHVRAVGDAVSAKLEIVISRLVDGRSHPAMQREMRRAAGALIEGASDVARERCHDLLQYEDDEVHTSNHYYMDIVQDLRREILQDDGIEQARSRFALLAVLAEMRASCVVAVQVWSTGKRPFLADLDFKTLKAKSNAEQAHAFLTSSRVPAA